MPQRISHSVTDAVWLHVHSASTSALGDETVIRELLEWPPSANVWLDPAYLVALMIGTMIGMCMGTIFFFFG